MIEKQKACLPAGRGCWIAFEGNDYSGKTDQCQRLADYLTEDLGIGPVITTREPGGYWYAEKIRGLILDPEIKDDPETQLLLFTAARRRNIKKTIEPALESGTIILADRSEGSTYDYQHHQYGLDLRTVEFINDFATGGIKPDLTLLLDITERTAFLRRAERTGMQTSFDSASDEIFRIRREGYLDIARKYDKKYGLNPWIVIDANRSKDEVFMDVLEAVKKSGLIKGLV